jgi:hypothetical protein
MQQWMVSGRGLPTEWLLMVGFGSLAWLLWLGLRPARDSLSNAQRRSIILEESSPAAAAVQPAAHLDVITK